MKSYPVDYPIKQSATELILKMKGFGKSEKEIAEACLTHITRRMNQIGEREIKERGLFDSLKLCEYVYFTYEDGDSLVEVSASKHKRELSEEIRTINSMYDCTGHLFTTSISQTYSPSLDMYVIVNRMSRDV